MWVVYQGPDSGVRLAPVAGDIWMPRDVPVEVPDEIGRALCDQAHFRPAKPRRRTESPGDPLADTETPEASHPADEVR